MQAEKTPSGMWGKYPRCHRVLESLADELAAEGKGGISFDRSIAEIRVLLCGKVLLIRSPTIQKKKSTVFREYARGKNAKVKGCKSRPVPTSSFALSGWVLTAFSG